ncbi:hypothetical protein niasHT_016880 [Heterodera trifolii]|uniref:Uncharacterized protein n=1 Tax=Heterodera trifolii TaxID=157864 RepID=A0ABD2KTH6_9BILA
MLKNETAAKFAFCQWSSPNSMRPNFGGIPKKLNLATLLLLLLVLLTFGQTNLTDAARRIYRVRSNSVEKLHNRTTKKCLAERDPIMRIMADQLCELCHGMFSHVNPNLRAQCSSKCYKNAQFRKCLEMYTALPEGHPGGTVETKRNEEKGAEGRETGQWQWAQSERTTDEAKRNGRQKGDKRTVAIVKYL